MISEWLCLHELKSDTVSDCIGCIESGHLQLDLDGRQEGQGAAAQSGFESLDLALSTVIIPSISAALCMDSSVFAAAVQSIGWNDVSAGELPHTIDNGIGQPPEIRMSWQGSVSDLMCLAHEVAHAIQLKL